MRQSRRAMTFQGRWVSVLPHVATNGAEVKFPLWFRAAPGVISLASLNLSGFVAGRSGPGTRQNRPFWLCSRWQGPTRHTGSSRPARTPSGDKPTVCPSVASRNPLLYQSLPIIIPFRDARLRRRKDGTDVDTTARGVVERLHRFP